MLKCNDIVGVSSYWNLEEYGRQRRTTRGVRPKSIGTRIVRDRMSVSKRDGVCAFMPDDDVLVEGGILRIPL